MKIFNLIVFLIYSKNIQFVSISAIEHIFLVYGINANLFFCILENKHALLNYNVKVTNQILDTLIQKYI